MTTLTITTFLMCPAGARAPLGGPPQERGGTGGHIRKDAEEWTHIGDLAVDLLVEQTRRVDMESQASSQSGRHGKEVERQMHGSDRLLLCEVGPVVRPIIRTEKSAVHPGAGLHASAVLRWNAARAPALNRLIVVYTEFTCSGDWATHQADGLGRRVLDFGGVIHGLEVHARFTSNAR